MKSEATAEVWRSVLGAAAAEACRRGDRRLGTDHLLLGLLAQPGSEAVAALGCSLHEARSALDRLDREALRAIGVTVASWPEGEKHRPSGRMPVLSSGARAVLVRALAGRPHGRALAETHVLAALLETTLPDPAAQLLNALGVTPGAVLAGLGASAARAVI